ncbi:MAG TPA: helix-turn-helix transcriptional regulator [Vicinamibacterales bacterium]|nr:helix-turn-helix transcriptional regulator [Vicinamibacterales bacterium]
MPPALSQSEVLILVAIARLGDEAYGVTIRQELHDCTGRDVSMAAVYAALDRLERRGLARARLSEPLPERGGRARRLYALTPAGRAIVLRERDIALRIWQDLPLEAGERRR